MVTGSKQHPGDEFLDTLRREGTQLSIFLVGGIRLIGRIEAFDNYTILLGSPAGTQLIYRHGISTILPVAAARPAAQPAETAKTGDASVLESKGQINRSVTLKKKKRWLVAVES